MRVRPSVAMVGSRDITPGEAAHFRQTAAWCVRRGLAVRSGGAKGSDEAAGQGAALVDPALLTVCLPEDSARARSRVPTGASIELPPYSDEMVELAVAEWELGARLEREGLPPYGDPLTQERVRERRSWSHMARRAGRDEHGFTYIQQLMIRNVAILQPDGCGRVEMALGYLGSKSGGGGTGHTFRIAHALGIPTYDLRAPIERQQAGLALRELAEQWERTRSLPKAEGRAR